MNSFILVSKNPDQKQTYLNNFITEHTISPFDVLTIAEEGSVGIEIVRRIQETIFLKPYKSTEKIIVIKKAETLTPEAQNALLKLLEEPPTYTYIFLCAPTEDAFLPTILSRCKIILLEEQKEATTEEQKNLLHDQLRILQQGTIGEKLALAETLAGEKEHLPRWFEDMEYFAREKMIHDTDNILTFARVLEALQEGNKTLLTTNVNPRIVLEHVFLTI